MRRGLRFIFGLPILALVFNISPRLLFGQDADAPKVSQEPGKTVQDKFEEEGESKESDYVRKRIEWFHDQRAYPHKTLPPGIRQAAAKARDRKVALEAEARKALAPNGNASEPAWTLIGPQPLGFYGVDAGRVTAIAINPTNPQIIYIGGAEGGVWKSVDGGTNWLPLTDSQVSLATGSIALDPSNPNNVYVGTGEENFSGDSYYGAGVLKSTDGGQTWTQSAGDFTGGPCGGNSIGAIAVHPTNGQIVLAGAQGCYYGSPSIFRSTDGGTTWTAVLTPSDSWMPVTGIVFDPTNGNLVYAATYNAGLFKSTDGGQTWNPANGTGANVIPTSNPGRAAIAIAPSSTSTLYAAIADPSSSNLLGMYKTVDGGNNWTQLTNAPDFCATQCWYDIVLAVSPTNANFVVAGGVYPYHPGGSAVTTSADGGTTWVDQSSGLHPDTHALAFTPNGSMLYTGNDGGMWSTTSPTANQISWTDLNNTLAITEFYPGISMDQSNVNHSYIGSQDNASEKYSGALTWESVNCGDGGATLIDYVTTTNIYVNCIELSLQSSPDDGNTWYDATNGLNSGDRTAWVPPLAMDPVHPTTLYFGTYQAYQSTNSAQQWNSISGDLTTGSGTLSTITVAPTDPNTIYTGSSDGQVNVTRNALATGSVTWTNVTNSLTLPNRSVNWIAVDPTIATTAYVGFSGFTGYGDSLGHIFKTTNAGSTWTDISSDLPNTPVDAILVDPDSPQTIFIGTDIGAFYTTTGGTSWSTLGTGLPDVVVTGLGLHEASRTLRASTHGRSTWDLDISTLAALPTISTISPTTTTADGASFTLTVNGTQFNTNSEVIWNSSPLATTFVNSSQVTATVPASDLLNGGTVTISVMNGAGGKLSNSATLTVENPVPVLTSLSKNSVPAGSASFTLTVTGSKFVSNSKIEWNGTALTTTYGSQTSLSATIPGTDLVTAGTASVTVLNPTPQGGTSGTLTFNINNSAPTFSATNLSFGSENVGAATASQSLTMTNTGSAALSISSISVTGANASSFVFANGCGTSLAAGANCSIHGHFAPVSSGALTAAITITDNAVGSPQSIALSGTGVAAAGVKLSATSLSFGSVNVGMASASQAVTLTNSGDAALSITSITVTGTNAPSFVFANSCGASLAAGANCSIHGHFGPLTAGALSAAITITDNAGGSPQSIALSGTGVAVPAVTLSATHLSFGSENVGSASASQTVTLTNSGDAALSMTSISVTGTNASSFVFANGCGTSLVAGANCTIHGHFGPLASGALTAAITITDNAGGSPQSIALTGTGVSTGPVLALSATSLSFGNENVGSSTASKSVTLTNTGGAALTITSISVTGADVSSFVFANSCGTSLVAGANCTIHGHFGPVATGALTGAITITDNASGSPQNIALSGTGVAGSATKQ